VIAHSLSRLFIHAAREGKAAEMTALIRGLAAFRPAFADESGLERMPAPVPVCCGTAAPGLICFPSFIGAGGALEYARLARGFRGVRGLSVLHAPGFADRESLPADLAALASAHAGNIRASAGREPFVLAGHSSGSLVAHAVASYLECTGNGPMGVVLLDPSGPASLNRWAFPASPEVSAHGGQLRADGSAAPRGHWRAFGRMALTRMEQARDTEDDAWLTAMVHYFFLDWPQLARTAVPTLLVRASEPMDGAAESTDWQASWDLAADMTVADVPGNHFSMMAEHADTTARAVNEWLTKLVIAG
jgi:polyketide synthase 12